MSSGTLPPGRPRPVGRGPKVRTAILAAALAELYETGYAGLSIDNVARRAGVNKTTVYRRWKDRQSMVVDAITDLVAIEVPVPDTGAIDTDLRNLTRSLVRMLASPTGRALFAAMLSASHIPEIAEVKHRFLDDRIRRAEPVIRGAIQRGELPTDTDPTELVKALIAPVYLRLLGAEALDVTVADRAARAALAAARAGVLNRSN